MKEMKRKYDFSKMTERKFNTMVNNYEEALNNMRQQYIDLEENIEKRIAEEVNKVKAQLECCDIERREVQAKLEYLEKKNEELKQVFIKGVLN